MSLAADGGWGEDWSEDVERIYDAPPPLGLNDRQMRVYRRIYWHDGRAGSIPSQKKLAAELDIPLRTLKYDIAALKEKGWLGSTGAADVATAAAGGCWAPTATSRR
jgi:hypothetical protein